MLVTLKAPQKESYSENANKALICFFFAILFVLVMTMEWTIGTRRWRVCHLKLQGTKQNAERNIVIKHEIMTHVLSMAPTEMKSRATVRGQRTPSTRSVKISRGRTFCVANPLNPSSPLQHGASQNPTQGS